MEARIKACLANPENDGRVKQVLDSFTLNPPDESGISLPDLGELTKAARDCLQENWYTVPRAQYHSHLVIRKLGKEKQKKTEAGGKKDQNLTARKMARVMCAYGEDVTLSVLSRSNGHGQMNMQFVISSESGSSEPMVSMIRSAYGKVEAELIPEVPDCTIRLCATGGMIFRGKEDGKKNREKEFENYYSWITSVLNSLPSGGDYTVKMRFTPVQAEEKIQKRINELNGHYRTLRFYSELNWGNNVNLGTSFNKGQNMIASSVGVDSRGASSGYAMNLSGADVHLECKQLAEQIEVELQRISQPLWAVGICVSAEDYDTLQTLTSAITGTLGEANICLNWSQNGRPAPTILNVDEVLPLMLFPTREFCGFSFVENEEFSLVSQSDDQKGFQIGNILWNGAPFSSFCLAPDALSRHAFICGMTGSGKTNTLFKIMEGINLPFCVIEPVKGEYRALRSICPDMKVWTMKVTDDTDPTVQVMRINPFWFPRNGNLAFHIDSLKTIISSCFELTAAMPNILEQCMYNVYVKAGWDLVTNRNIYWDKVPEEYLYPTFSDLCSEVENYLNNSDFSGDLMSDYKGAMLSRLKSFVNGYKGILLNTDVHPDYEQIMHGHCVLELEGLADDADKCLVMGTILVQYYEYLKLHFKDSTCGQNLQHILVIEEAHRLFKNTANGKQRAEGGQDPTGQLVDSLSNMMAEIRAFGEGMLIVDQSPTKIAEDVIKNSATKIVHRIDNSNDIKAMQSSMLLPDDLLSFAMLRQGEALIRTDGMEKPCKVKMLCSSVKEEYGLATSFRAEQIVESELADTFVAASVLGDEKAALMIQEKLSVFLNSLALIGVEKWEVMVEDLIYEILNVLKQRRHIDAVDYRMSVLFEIVSLSIKRLFSTLSKKDLASIHMLTMRLLEFYQDRRGGKYINPCAVDLFRQFLNTNVLYVLTEELEQQIDGRAQLLLCRELGLESDGLLALMLSKYVHDVYPALEAGTPVPAPEELMDSFLLSTVSLSLREPLREQYSVVFERLAAYLSRLIKNKAV